MKERMNKNPKSLNMEALEYNHLMGVGGWEQLISCRTLFAPLPVDEDMTPWDMTIDYKVRLFLHLHSDFWYNSLGSTCTCHYLIVGTNVSHSASPSMLNIQVIGSPIILHWEGHNSFIRSEFEVHEQLTESFQIDLVPPQYHVGKASKSLRYSVAMGLLFTLETQAQVGAHPQEVGEHLRDAQGRPPPWTPP
jgi:hypothetical protein